MIHIVLWIAVLASAMPDACPPPRSCQPRIIISGGQIEIDSVWRDVAILDLEGPPVSTDEAIDRVLRWDTPSTGEPGLDLDPHLTDHVRGAVTPSPAPEGGSIQ